MINPAIAKRLNNQIWKMYSNSGNYPTVTTGDTSFELLTVESDKIQIQTVAWYTTDDEPNTTWIPLDDDVYFSIERSLRETYSEQ